MISLWYQSDGNKYEARDPMKAAEEKIQEIFATRKYFIPSYQRPYSWDEDNAKELVDDIYESYKETSKEYFIGSLICISKDSSTFEVVDGQQRLITMTLLFKALIESVPIEDVKYDLKNKIILKDVYNNKNAEVEPRIRVRNKEFDVYMHYLLQGDKKFLPKNPSYTQQLLIKNFDVFLKYFEARKNEGVDLLAFTSFILKNVYVVFVTTNSFASSYRLFNVLNTRGLSLSQSDLIKNKIFEIAEENKINHDDIERHWDEIENLIGIQHMDGFLIANEISQQKTRDQAAVPRTKLVEAVTKRIQEKYKSEMLAFTSDLKKSAINYKKIKDIDFDGSLRNILYCLNFFESDEWMTAFLAFLNKTDENNGPLKFHDFKKFVEFFEKVYLHKWFSEEAKGQRRVVCYAAIVEINSNKQLHGIIQSLYKYKNNEGLENYLNSDVYDKNSSSKLRLIRYVLFRIDQYMQDESITKIYHGTITIEHILPKTINNVYWNIRFSEEEQRQWVHKLGNLTLISGVKNSQASNSGFNKKMDIYKGGDKGDKKVSFDIAKEILNYSEWNLDSLSKRHEKLIGLSKDIWYITPLS